MNSSTEKSSDTQTSTQAPKDEAAHALKSNVVAEAQQLGGQAKNVATEVMTHAKDSAQSSIGSGKNRAAESLGNVAEALRHTGENMRTRTDVQSGLTDYVTRAADRVESASTYLQNRQIGDILGDVSDFARREPALFLGGAFALGLVGGRFLKSSSSSRATSGGGSPRVEYGNGNQQLALRSGSEFGAAGSAQPDGAGGGDAKEPQSSTANPMEQRPEYRSSGVESSASAGRSSNSSKGQPRARGQSDG
jgi:hypothetical protein